jgi:hypothetical protein
MKYFCDTSSLSITVQKVAMYNQGNIQICAVLLKKEKLAKNRCEIAMALQFIQAKILRICGSSPVPSLKYLKIKISFPSCSLVASENNLFKWYRKDLILSFIPNLWNLTMIKH